MIFSSALLLVVELGHVNQAFDTIGQFDERAEVGQTDDLAFDRVADVVGEELVPHVRGELLEAERQPLVLGVDVEHDRLDLVALLQDLGRVLHPLGPGHVGDVDEAVDALLDLDERAEIGEVADAADDLRADRILLGQLGQGFASTCLRPSEMRRADGSTPSTMASTLSPTFRTSTGA